MKKGFTLIELLAVIVILAVIALIAIPTIGSVIEDSRKKAFEITCNEVYRSYDQYEVGELYLTGTCNMFEFGVEREEIEIKNGITYLPVNKLDLNGELPTGGYLRMCNEELKAMIDNGKYTCIRDENGIQILDGKVEENDTTEPVINVVNVNSTTNSIQVVVLGIEDEGIITKYYYSINGEEYIESESNQYRFEGLQENKEYQIKVQLENGKGLKSEEHVEMVKTGELTNPSIYEISATVIEGYEYATERVIEIEYISTSIERPEYYLKSSVEATVEEGVIIGECGSEEEAGTCQTSNVTTLEAGVWYRTSKMNTSIRYEANGTLYAMTGDGINISGMSSYTVSKIDINNPSAKINIGSIKTDRIMVVGVCRDNESGIVKYEYSIDNGKTWIDNGGKGNYTFSGLEAEKQYVFKIRCTNGAGLTNEGSNTSTTLGLTNPSISPVSETITSGYDWATEKVIGITYVNTNIENPVYYFKSSVKAKVATGVITGTCGSGTEPVGCTTSNVTTLEANTWYRTGSPNINVIYQENGTLYALTSDGTNISGMSSYTVSKISTGTPSVPEITGGSEEWSSTEKTISVTKESTETSGIKRYQYYISTSSSSQTGGSWTNIGEGVKQVIISTNGERYIYFRAIANNGKISGASNAQVTKIDTGVPSAPTISGGSTDWTSGTRTISVSKAASATSGISHYQYYISTSSTSQTGGSWTNIASGTTSVSISTNGERYIYFRGVSTVGKEGTVSTAQPTKIDTGIPSAPEITGGSTTWTNSSRTISVIKEASATSGISHYQYYISTSSSEQTGGSWIDLGAGVKEVTISTNGERYIYFRGVSIVGSEGTSSAAQTTKVDTENPSVTASVSGKTATFTVSDNIGVIGYGINQSTSSAPSFTPITNTTSSQLTWTASAAGSYVVWVRDNAGRTANATFNIPTSAFNYTATKTTYMAVDTGHKHSGSSGLDYANGCYTTATNQSVIVGGGTFVADGTLSCGCLVSRCNSCGARSAYSSPTGCTISGHGDHSGAPGWNHPHTQQKTVYTLGCGKTQTTNYTCPKGGTLSGTTCVLYTCPNGGTLSGTTCIVG